MVWYYNYICNELKNRKDGICRCLKMNLKEKKLSSDYRFNGRIINLRVDNVELPNGKTAEREVVEHPGGVCVAALTERDELLMVRQFRYPYMQELLEIPAGKLERGEIPLECGKRELIEETGAHADDLHFLGELYPTPGYTDEIIRIFWANVTYYGDSSPDEDEFLECERVPLQKAFDMVVSNEIKDAKTQVAVMKLYCMKKSLAEF